MMTRLGDRVHFLHLRNVTRESEGTPYSFPEAEHLDVGTDMVARVKAALDEESRLAVMLVKGMSAAIKQEVS